MHSQAPGCCFALIHPFPLPGGTCCTFSVVHLAAWRLFTKTLLLKSPCCLTSSHQNFATAQVGFFSNNTCLYLACSSNIYTSSLDYLGSKVTFDRVTQETRVCFPTLTDILFALGSCSHSQLPPLYNSIKHDLLHFPAALCPLCITLISFSQFPSVLCNLTSIHPKNCKNLGFLRYK